MEAIEHNMRIIGQNMADSLGDILGDSSGADFEDSVHESDKFNITN